MNSIFLCLVAALGSAEHEADPGMSPELKAFLVAEDLDDIGDARQKIKSVMPTDAAAIRAVLKQWSNAQAVSNLLIHADLIPEDIRLASLFRGLAERRVDYYVVAALVGLSEVDSDKLPEQDRKRLANMLLTIIRDTKDVRAKRASLTFENVVSADNAPQVIALMEHPDDTVRSNLRSWLFKTFGDRGIVAFTASARQSSLGEEAQRRLLADFKEHVKIADRKARESKLIVLFAYIPNLKDYEPHDAAGFYNRANGYFESKDYDRAVENYNEAIRLDPKEFMAYSNRGCAYHAKKDYDRAIKDFSEAIRLDPSQVLVYENRGSAYRRKRDYDRAVEDYTEAVRRDPKRASACDALARLLATCPLQTVRDGRKARDYASKACELTDRKKPEHLDTMAASCAECGDYDEAVRWMKMALESPGLDKKTRGSLEDRLRLYEQHKPYREE
jgi:tetratricopeptide (TPR) repeat protein